MERGEEGGGEKERRWDGIGGVICVCIYIVLLRVRE